MIKVIAPKRKADKHGMGHFGAPRGDRKHIGIDYACAPGSQVLSTVTGIVTKLGYAYADDLSFRYVEITEDHIKHRFFYVEPSVKEGDYIKEDEIIGASQSLNERYEGITEHVHYEILDRGNNPLDPDLFFATRAE